MTTVRQVNTHLTLRNWVIGLYIREYEQRGADRAQYGEKVLLNLSQRLHQKGLKSMGERRLREYRLFYQMYPQIWRTASDKFQSIDNQIITSLFLPKEIMENIGKIDIVQSSDIRQNDPDLLVNRLTYSHFLELLNSHRRGSGFNVKDIIRNPYMLDFLELEDKPEFSESDLEQAIITHLQKFLMELGRGFCFEARQRRITFGNKHYRIDLVFYHRILKCHVLIDLKIGDFDHSDAGQMNLYLNYFRENEMTEGDNPPVGVILCAQKDAALVH